MHCCSAVCGVGKGRKLLYTSSQVFGVVEKIPGCLQSYVQLERALWFACTKYRSHTESDVCKYCNGAVLACGMDERVGSHKYSQLRH